MAMQTIDSNICTLNLTSAYFCVWYGVILKVLCASGLNIIAASAITVIDSSLESSQWDNFQANLSMSSTIVATSIRFHFNGTSWVTYMWFILFSTSRDHSTGKYLCMQSRILFPQQLEMLPETREYRVKKEGMHHDIYDATAPQLARGAQSARHREHQKNRNKMVLKPCNMDWPRQIVQRACNNIQRYRDAITMSELVMCMRHNRVESEAMQYDDGTSWHTPSCRLSAWSGRATAPGTPRTRQTNSKHGPEEQKDVEQDKTDCWWCSGLKLWTMKFISPLCTHGANNFCNPPFPCRCRMHVSDETRHGINQNQMDQGARGPNMYWSICTKHMETQNWRALFHSTAQRSTRFMYNICCTQRTHELVSQCALQLVLVRDVVLEEHDGGGVHLISARWHGESAQIPLHDNENWDSPAQTLGHTNQQWCCVADLSYFVCTQLLLAKKEIIWDGAAKLLNLAHDLPNDFIWGGKTPYR